MAALKDVNYREVEGAELAELIGNWVNGAGSKKFQEFREQLFKTHNS